MLFPRFRDMQRDAGGAGRYLGEGGERLGITWLESAYHFGVTALGLISRRFPWEPAGFGVTAGTRARGAGASWWRGGGRPRRAGRAASRRPACRRRRTARSPRPPTRACAACVAAPPARRAPAPRP